MQREKEVVIKIQNMGCNFSRRDLFNRYCKKIDAYLKRNGLSLDKEKEYFEKYTEEEFDNLIKQHYNIRGNLTPQNILRAKPKNQIKETEHDIQVKVVKYLAKLNIKHFAIPNGFVRGSDNRVENARYVNYMKAEGLKNGAPDLVILPGDGKVVFLELKTAKGKPSEYQLEWQEFFDRNGYNYTIIYGYEAAERFIKMLVV